MSVKRLLMGVVSLCTLLLMVFPSVDVTANTTREVENLVAFTKLLGYVRYFHPADSATDVDWDTFAATHVESVMAAADDAALINVLSEIFTPYAPAVQIYEQGNAPELPSELTASDTANSVIQWVHVPLMDSSSDDRYVIPPERVTIPLENGTIPAEFSYRSDRAFTRPETMLPVHNPAEPYIANLSDTIEASIPMALYVDENGTIPQSTAPELDTVTITGNTLAGRLTAVMFTWNFHQHFFSYWDVLENMRGINWDAALPEALNNAIEDENAGDFWYTLQRLTAYLNDGHVSVSPSPEAIQHIGGENIGGSYQLPFTWDIVEGELTITTLLSDDTQGINAGDVILEIDGQPAMERLEAARQLNSRYGAFGDFYILLEWLAGQDGSTVSLTIDPVNGDENYTADITRNTAFTQESYTQRENRPDVISDLGSNILYVDLTRLTTGEYTASIERMAAADGLIFDMRGYPTNAAISILGHLRGENLSSAPFLVPITVTPDHIDIRLLDITSDSWIIGKNTVFTDNVAFITNSNGAVSYAESIMGIVEGYQLAEIIGSRTAGANGNVAFLLLPASYRMSFTSLHVLRFDGSPLFTVGVQPTIPVERTRDGVAAGRDELLEVAFETVGGTELSVSAVEVDTSQLDTFWEQVESALSVNWTQVDDGTWQEIGSGSFIFAEMEEGTIDSSVSDLRATLPEEDLLDDGTALDNGWTVHRITESLDGMIIAFAFYELDGTVYMIGLYTAEENFDLDYESDFLPLLDNLTIE